MDCDDAVRRSTIQLNWNFDSATHTAFERDMLQLYKCDLFNRLSQSGISVGTNGVPCISFVGTPYLASSARVLLIIQIILIIFKSTLRIPKHSYALSRAAKAIF